MADVEIELLKQELATLTGAVNALGLKVDHIMAMQLQITRLQEQQENSRAAIDRSFKAIEEIKDKSNKTESDLSRAISFVKGSIMVGALLFAFAQWWVLEQLQDMKVIKSDVPVIERRLSLVERDIQRDWSGEQ